MPGVCRVGDKAKAMDSHGRKCCPHMVQGPGVSGSSDVTVNGMPVLRVGDPGVHSGCCGPNKWECAAGSGTVLVNGMPVVRQGDATKHCGGSGTMTEGSGDVSIG